MPQPFCASPVPPASAVARGSSIVDQPKEMITQVVWGATGDKPGVLEEVMGQVTRVDPLTWEKQLDLPGEFLNLRR